MTVTNVWTVDAGYTVAGMSNTVTMASEQQLYPYKATYQQSHTQPLPTTA